MSKKSGNADNKLEIRPLDPADLPFLAEFAGKIPAHDLLFLSRDIREPRVQEAWIAAVAAGEMDSLIARVDGKLAGTIASLSDALSWSRHVWDIRLLVAPSHRNRGLGRKMLDTAITRACSNGATKLTARMTPDQVGAITLFEESGFRAEALLRDHVRDAEGRLHDLVVLFLDPAQNHARRLAYSQ